MSPVPLRHLTLNSDTRSSGYPLLPSVCSRCRDARRVRPTQKPASASSSADAAGGRHEPTLDGESTQARAASGQNARMRLARAEVNGVPRVLVEEDGAYSLATVGGAEFEDLPALLDSGGVEPGAGVEVGELL